MTGQARRRPAALGTAASSRRGTGRGDRCTTPRCLVVRGEQARAAHAARPRPPLTALDRASSRLREQRLEPWIAPQRLVHPVAQEPYGVEAALPRRHPPHPGDSAVGLAELGVRAGEISGIGARESPRAAPQFRRSVLPRESIAARARAVSPDPSDAMAIRAWLGAGTSPSSMARAA